MKKNEFLFLLIIVFIGSLSCSNEPLLTTTEYENKIEFSVEASENNSSPLILKMKTVDDFSCSNYKISTEHSVSETGYISVIPLQNVIEENICSTALGPAATEIEFEVEKGSYTLGLRNTYRLETFGISFLTDTLIVNKISSEADPYFILIR